MDFIVFVLLLLFFCLVLTELVDFLGIYFLLSEGIVPLDEVAIFFELTCFLLRIEFVD